MTMSGPPPATEAVVLTDASQIGEARRGVAALCGRLGMDETTTGQASLLATEAATNVIRHAGSDACSLRTNGTTCVTSPSADKRRRQIEPGAPGNSGGFPIPGC